MNSNNSFAINPSLKIDHVHLKAYDLRKSIAFYQDIFGFKVLEKESTEKNSITFALFCYLGFC